MSLKAALEKTVDPAAAPPSGEGEQLPLLPTPLSRPGEGTGPVARPAEARGRGRPPGAQNKRTAAWVEYLQAQGFSHPLHVLAEMYSMPTGDLARVLGCTAHEAFIQQRQAAEASLPYWASKMPVDLNVTGAGVVQLVLGGGEEAASAGPFTLVPPGEQNQGVIEAKAEHSNSATSNGLPQGVDPQAETAASASVPAFRAVAPGDGPKDGGAA